MNKTRHIKTLIHAGALALILLLQTGCTEESEISISIANKPLTEEISNGPVKVSISLDPGKVELHKDNLLILKINRPSEIKLSIPDIADRISGFTISGTYNQEPITENGQTIIEAHFLLTPVISDEYRIAPMPITYEDMSTSPSQKRWFPTRPIELELISPLSQNIPDDIAVEMTPVWVYPPFKTVAKWVVAGIIGCILIWLLWKVTRRVHKEIKLMRMSPKERALKELAVLIAKNLPEKDMIKDFYIELTMVVRRYIERCHKIKAPEQTTEEFLDAVLKNHNFNEMVIKTLKEFLEAADLVKFAAHHPDKLSIDRATQTAKNYIISDHADKEKEQD